MTTSRRNLVRTLALGGVAGAVALPSSAEAASWAPRLLPARDLRVGDIIVGPDATVVRVQGLKLLATGRIRVRYTDPHTTTATARPMSTEADISGYTPDHPFVVLARNTVASAVKLTATRPSLVIDGGTP